jgi:hypothetical protein
MNSLSSAESEDAVLSGLLAYCADHDIWISPSVVVRRVPGKGLGVYTSKAIPVGERIMHVPTAALFTAFSIRSRFAPPKKKKNGPKDAVPVHASLAAYFAFGLSEAGRHEHARWMATWPRLSDFTSTMPIFWPERTKRVVGKENNETTGFLPLPPSLTGNWKRTSSSSSSSSSSSEDGPTTTKLADVQHAKFVSHLQRIAAAFPDRATALVSPRDPLHWRFVHAWSAVNSRCFYYLRAGQQPPKDSNEGMALCPGMDLFNHHAEDGGDAAGGSCRTTYDRKGYYVTTERAYGQGEEVLLSYGPHGNDTLWTEYGFTMDRNRFDGLALDEVVVPTVTDAQKMLLEAAGYWGDYWLKPEGLCWRTEAVSWLDEMSLGRWRRFVEGKYDPEEAERKTAHSMKRKRGADTAGDADDMPSVRAKKRQIAWIDEIGREAEDSLRGLLAMADQGGGNELVDVFADDEVTLQAQCSVAATEEELSSTRSGQATLRHRMCVQRWRQIWKLCLDATTKIRATNPHLQNEQKDPGREKNEEAVEALERLVNDFLVG